ncbi:MAG: phosphoribosylglycinamide formyltransferase [Saprospiraceae bacterium]|nr:phosphoribosylglycinamide formyltransferase [Saprospiraceae bacterium]MCB9324573.1 phosphoribosylglycinamide formyltransferase [Lewinellaceae bacterium]
MKNIAIFASGTGSNARRIVEHFQDKDDYRVALVVSNRHDALVLKMAEEYGIDQLVISRDNFYHSEEILKKLSDYKIDFIALAGFLWLIPEYLVKAYEKKMINIHPALLPQYGGKGMYGHHVHHAVKAAGESESGITIHYVNTKYDEGDIVFQARCALEEDDTPEEIARKVLGLEHRHFPEIIEKILKENS